MPIIPSKASVLTSTVNTGFDAGLKLMKRELGIEKPLSQYWHFLGTKAIFWRHCPHFLWAHFIRMLWRGHRYCTASQASERTDRWHTAPVKSTGSNKLKINRLILGHNWIYPCYSHGQWISVTQALKQYSNFQGQFYVHFSLFTEKQHTTSRWLLFNY